jgi:hypothetical protein
MGVNVEVTQPEGDDREYPWLGVCGGMVVLFSANGVGTVVAAVEDEREEGFRVGDYGDDWDIDFFDAFDGEVALANNAVRVDGEVLEELPE